MARFILRYSGDKAPEEHFGIAAEASNLTVVDRAPKMMLVEGSEDDAKRIVDKLPGWTLHPEVQYKIPDARKHIDREYS